MLCVKSDSLYFVRRRFFSFFRRHALQTKERARLGTRLCFPKGRSWNLDRGDGSVRITEPENLRGVVFTFRGTENRVNCGETSIPLSDGACAGGRDWLNAARANGKRKGDTLAFVRDGACFEIKYENGEPAYVTITRGGLVRRAAITVEKSD